MRAHWICCGIVACLFSFSVFADKKVGPAICEASLVDLFEIQGEGISLQYTTGNIHFLNLSSYFLPGNEELNPPLNLRGVSDLTVRATLMAIAHTLKRTTSRPLDVRLVFVDQFLDDDGRRLPHLSEYDSASESINISMDNVFAWAAQNNRSPFEALIITASREAYLRAAIYGESSMGILGLEPGAEDYLGRLANQEALKTLQLFLPE